MITLENIYEEAGHEFNDLLHNDVHIATRRTISRINNEISMGILGTDKEALKVILEPTEVTATITGGGTNSIYSATLTDAVLATMQCGDLFVISDSDNNDGVYLIQRLGTGTGIIILITGDGLYAEATSTLTIAVYRPKYNVVTPINNGSVTCNASKTFLDTGTNFTKEGVIPGDYIHVLDTASTENIRFFTITAVDGFTITVEQPVTTDGTEMSYRIVRDDHYSIDANNIITLPSWVKSVNRLLINDEEFELKSRQEVIENASDDIFAIDSSDSLLLPSGKFGASGDILTIEHCVNMVVPKAESKYTSIYIPERYEELLRLGVYSELYRMKRYFDENMIPLSKRDFERALYNASLVESAKNEIRRYPQRLCLLK